MADTLRVLRSRMLPTFGMWLAGALLSVGMARGANTEAVADCYVKGDTWQATLLATREKLQALQGEEFDTAFKPAWRQMEKDFPIPCDWLLQDLGKTAIKCFRGGNDRQSVQTLLENVGKELGDEAEAVKQRIVALKAENPPPSDVRWWDLYFDAAEHRRAARLRTVLAESPRLLFLKHKNLHGSHYAYTEAQSDAQAEHNFWPKSALCVLEMKGIYGEQKTLISDPEGVLRDPDISFDGKRALFAWKKSDWMDDFHLHEIDLETLRTRQITHGLGFADYEGIYLPDGDILFNSTRCVQTVDCWWTEVSNIYACDNQGRQLRRLGFDQVHSNYPQMLEDGRVTYTRWEYNDRGQIYPQPLYQMNADGTGQTEFYGNNSYFPTSILHARGIPGTQKVIAIASGHHSSQAGKLIVIDSSRGRQESQGVQLIAPVRKTQAVHVDAYGQDGDVWMYPYAFNEREFLVTFCPEAFEPIHDRKWRFGVYYMDIDGRRELLVRDPDLPCCQALPIRPRTTPVLRPTTVDYRKDSGVYYMQDVYAGAGLAGIPRGTVKTLRVVALDFRAAGIGANFNRAAMVSTPVAIGHGTWGPKIVLGTTPVYDDGSAMCTVPARTPVYFQALDAEGHVVQTMRSWSTLQPGETNSCTGCHESKNEAPPTYKAGSMALQQGAQPLAPFYGPPRGFSFAKEVQPILDKHCVSCHDDRSQYTSASPVAKDPAKRQAFSLLGESVRDRGARRLWSDAYLQLTEARLANECYGADPSRPRVNWVSAQSQPPMLKPYSAGAAKSQLISMLKQGHEGAKLSREEMDKIACWIDLGVPFCGDYREASAWTDGERKRYDRYQEKRRQMAQLEAKGVGELLAARTGDAKLAPVEATVELELAVVDAKGNAVAEVKQSATTHSAVRMELPRNFAPGDKVRVRGAKAIAISLSEALGEVGLFAPEEELEISVPENKAPYPPGTWDQPRPCITVRPLSSGETDAYRNLALNPYDVMGNSKVFPHSSSNSECRGNPVFAARNAIDGRTANTGHGGWPFQSWGPEQIAEPWWHIEFGREVEIEKVVLYVRADFPHDKHWHSGALKFSSGGPMGIRIEKTADRQVIRFPPRRTTSLWLDSLRQEQPLGWCAITEIEVYGRDAVPIAEDPAKPYSP